MAKSTVFVAMSGGVDSSLTAALLKTQGYQVVEYPHTTCPWIRLQDGPIKSIDAHRLVVIDAGTAPVFGSKFVYPTMVRAVDQVWQHGVPTKVFVTELTYRQMLRDMGENVSINISNSVLVNGTEVRYCSINWAVDDFKLEHGMALFYDANDEPFVEIDLLSTRKSVGVTGRATTLTTFEAQMRNKLDPSDLKDVSLERRLRATWNI